MLVAARAEVSVALGGRPVADGGGCSYHCCQAASASAPAWRSSWRAHCAAPQDATMPVSSSSPRGSAGQRRSWRTPALEFRHLGPPRSTGHARAVEPAGGDSAGCMRARSPCGAVWPDPVTPVPAVQQGLVASMQAASLIVAVHGQRCRSCCRRAGDPASRLLTVLSVTEPDAPVVATGLPVQRTVKLSVPS